MTTTQQLGLPLLQAAQAQKHVTVNEALARLDGLALLTLQSLSLLTPPQVVPNGLAWSVPVGAVNAWSGQDGKLAIGRNGGWDFVVPHRGWRAFVLDEGGEALFDGGLWRTGLATLSTKNAGMSLRVVQIDHTVAAGVTSITAPIIPANGVVVGVTARVVSALTGSLTAWSLGNPGAVGRYGSGLGLGQGAYARGVLGQPTAFYTPTPLQLDAVGGSFTDGTVRLAVHLIELALPDL